MTAGFQGLDKRPVALGVLLELPHQPQQVITVAIANRPFKLRARPRVLLYGRRGGISSFASVRLFLLTQEVTNSAAKPGWEFLTKLNCWDVVIDGGKHNVIKEVNCIVNIHAL